MASIANVSSRWTLELAMSVTVTEVSACRLALLALSVAAVLLACV